MDIGGDPSGSSGACANGGYRENKSEIKVLHNIDNKITKVFFDTSNNHLRS